MAAPNPTLIEALLIREDDDDACSCVKLLMDPRGMLDDALELVLHSRNIVGCLAWSGSRAAAAIQGECMVYTCVEAGTSADMTDEDEDRRLNELATYMLSSTKMHMPVYSDAVFVKVESTQVAGKVYRAFGSMQEHDIARFSKTCSKMNGPASQHPGLNGLPNEAEMAWINDHLKNAQVKIIARHDNTLPLGCQNGTRAIL
jgi:hypothetical protein